jgi:hypothetical protein
LKKSRRAWDHIVEIEYYIHPKRFPKNVAGPFYTLGDQWPDGAWCGQCLSCGVPEVAAPTLLSPLVDEDADTYFIRQPETVEEIEQACQAIEVCCVDALRYGGKDPAILARLGSSVCDYPLPPLHASLPEDGVSFRVFCSGLLFLAFLWWWWFS